ncbi:tRNA wybutosine-synthesizing protein 3 homolog isoform X2 [Nothobranchius furzeri]|uniref:tRNA wybutosine-synthesizing protein 3 homolog n=1 Tax=Nothobranchius furzeri TaxID=105023 RepID=A0A1A7ZBZ9_NOTFU|nr:tRNA wybutosine-synthesizing protein 3 homolog isoform X2 [Nothobranchius furzeri]KAF7222896.1 transcript variant X2 [Nothobranchius furzeri]
MEKSFRQWKKQCLNKLDQSKKGSVDRDIEHVVSLLNSREEFFTTSSCSGRTILIDGMSGLRRANGDAVLKFEPAVLHVQCRRLEDAQLLHSVAVNSGFRNSGLTVGKMGKIISAVRSTHGLEVPLTHNGKLLVDHQYIHFLTQTANQKMEENLKRIHRFYQNLQSALSAEKLPISDQLGSLELQHPQKMPEGEKEESNKNVYTRRRRRLHETDPNDEECNGSQPELGDCLSLFT